MHLSGLSIFVSLATIVVCSSDTYADNCNAAPPSSSGYKPPQFPTMKSVLQAAFVDATALASFAFGATNGIGEAQANTMYKHYYDAEFTNAEDMLQHVNMLSLWVSQGSNPSFSRWKVNFDCSGTLAGCSSSSNSLAVTDATVGGTLIEICKPFWTAPSTAFLLPGNNPNTSPLTKPFRDLTPSGWCNARQTSNFFATAGHTILHELTHLDSIGSLAGLAAGPNGRHGTDDFQEQNIDGCELRGARNYLTRWQADTTDGLASPDYNAESLAGFATEYFFNSQCNDLGDIPK